MLVEALIVNDNLRGQGIGGLMMKHIIKIAKSRNVKVIELSPNKQRSGAIDFYKNLGFEASHEGIKLYL